MINNVEQEGFIRFPAGEIRPIDSKKVDLLLMEKHFTLTIEDIILLRDAINIYLGESIRDAITKFLEVAG